MEWGQNLSTGQERTSTLAWFKTTVTEQMAVQGRPFRPQWSRLDQTDRVWSSPSRAAWHVYRTTIQFSIRTVPYESALDQSSTTNRGTRPNSFVFDVTRIKLRDSACPAIRVS